MASAGIVRKRSKFLCMQVNERESVGGVESSYQKVLGRKNGVVRSLTLELSTPDEPATKKVVSNVSRQDQLVDNDVSHNVVAASSKPDSLSDAFDGSIGETTDRYCLRFPPSDALEWATYEEMRAKAPVIDYEYVDIYDREQLAEHLKTFDRHTEIAWTKGTNLLTGEEVYVPAERVWFSSGELKGDYHMPTSSHGVAAGKTLEFGLVNALYETVEADGVMQIWCRQEAPPGIENASFADAWPDVHDFVTEGIEDEQYSVRLFDCETPVDLPVVGSVVHSPDGSFPRFAHSVASHLHPREAIHDSATEAATRCTYLYQKLLTRDLSSLNVDELDNFESNRLYYALPENFEEVSFYLDPDTFPVRDVYPESSASSRVDSKREEYRRLLEAFADANVTPIGLELTTPDVREMGIRVVRVLVPELVPVSAAAILPTNHPRLDGAVRTDKPHCF